MISFSLTNMIQNYYSHQYMDYFNGVTISNIVMTTAMMGFSVALQWVSFVPLIEHVAMMFGIDPGDFNGDGHGDGDGYDDGDGNVITIMVEKYARLVGITTLPAIVFYILVCVIIDGYYYYLKRDDYKLWKWQDKFPSLNDRKDMLWLSCRNLLMGGIYTSTLITIWPNLFKIYTNVHDTSQLYYIGSIVGFFVHIDLMAYMAHWWMHRPFLYRNIHKVHHRFIAISPMTALSMHWIEYLTQVTLTFAYLWAIPTHLNVVIFNLMYVFVFNIINHSGVMIESHLLWEPSTQYHDDHHRFFTVNYGQSLVVWDRLCGTLRSRD